MITLRESRKGAGRQARRRQLAFTFTELLIASSIHVLLLAGVISGHLAGLSMMGISQSGLSASDECRKVNNLLTADIRAAKYIMIGQGTSTTFTEVAAASPQQGTAMQVCATSDTNAYIRYYWDSADNGFKRIAKGELTPMIVAKYVGTNTIFTSEDFAGNVAVNRQSGTVLGVNLQFYQIDNPPVLIGPTNHYNLFSLQIKICSRSPD
jgi:Tfp pilus assembly protein PilW